MVAEIEKLSLKIFESKNKNEYYDNIYNVYDYILKSSDDYLEFNIKSFVEIYAKQLNNSENRKMILSVSDNFIFNDILPESESNKNLIWNLPYNLKVELCTDIIALDNYNNILKGELLRDKDIVAKLNEISIDFYNNKIITKDYFMMLGEYKNISKDDKNEAKIDNIKEKIKTVDKLSKATNCFIYYITTMAYQENNKITKKPNFK